MISPVACYLANKNSLNIFSYIRYMRKILLLLVLVTMNLVACAQAQQQRMDSVCALVKKYFNEKDAQKLYDLTGEDFHIHLPWETFKNVCNTNLFPIGEMKETILEK